MRWWRIKAEWTSYRLLRLRGFGRFDSVLSMVAHRRLGTPMYWHPPAERERIRREAAASRAVVVE